MIKKEILDEYSTMLEDQIICPYCGKYIDDSIDYENSDKTECPECEKVF